MIDVDSFRIKSIVDTIHEWLQVKEFLMENLNNFNMIAIIQNFTAILKITNILLPVDHFKAVKYVVTEILCVTHGI